MRSMLLDVFGVTTIAREASTCAVVAVEALAMMSTLPLYRSLSATCWSLIGFSVIVWARPAVPKYLSNRCRMICWFGVQDTNEYGPDPTGLDLAGAKLDGARMAMSVSPAKKSAFGLFSVITTVPESGVA